MTVHQMVRVVLLDGGRKKATVRRRASVTVAAIRAAIRGAFADVGEVGSASVMALTLGDNLLALFGAMILIIAMVVYVFF